jgi:hypothetical protein
MKKIYLLMAFVFVAFLSKSMAQTITISDSVATSTTWTNDHFYLIQGFVYVPSGVELTIQPGTIILGDHTFTGSSLIIERGAKIHATGTPEQPIIFTSDMPAGSRSSGDWGGLIICGKAPINTTGGQSQIEGGPRSYYGGTDANDNSGEMQYVRIEFAGYPFQPNKEINGLTMGGVGKGTTINHVQVSFANDDSYEWFGGNVDCKYLIAYRGLDDDFDTDYGYSGRGQFFIALRDSAIADVSGSNGFESDNDATGSTNAPYTSPMFSNVGIFGPKADLSNPVNPNFKRAMHIRRNSRLSCYNSVFAGHPTGMYIDGDLTDANANSNDLQIESCIMSGMGKFFDVPSGQLWSSASVARTWYFDATRHNDTLATNNLLKITDPFNYDAPNFIPLASSPLNGKASWLNARFASDTWFEHVTFAGPMGTTDWTTSWANWDPQHTVYALSVNENESNFKNVNIFPNPANSSASLSISLSSESHVSVVISTIAGQQVATLYDGTMNAGTQQISINTTDIPAGIYLVKIQSTNGSLTKKLVITK